VRIGRVKQKDVRGIAAAGAVARLVADALGRDSFDGYDLASLVGFVERVEDAAAAALATDDHVHVFSGALQHMAHRLHRPREEVLAGIAEVASQTSVRLCYPCTGYALASVVTASYVALTGSSFEQALIDTVNLGGDADTTGAMVGAICGALYGFEAIPPRWHEALMARGIFEDRVEAMVGRPRDWRPMQSLASIERAWTEALLVGP